MTLKAMARSNAVASILFLCAAVYLYAGPIKLAKPEPFYAQDQETIKLIRSATDIEILRKVLLYETEKKHIRARDNDLACDVFLKIAGEMGAGVGLLAFFFFASNALAMHRMSRASSSTLSKAQNAL